MKNRYRLVKVGSRGGVFYYDDTSKRKPVRKSLRTRDEGEAERLVHAMNEAEHAPAVNNVATAAINGSTAAVAATPTSGPSTPTSGPK